MTDPRVSSLARVLVRYCLDLKPGKELQIEAPYLAEPLVREVYREAVIAGAHVMTRISISGLGPIFFKHASETQLKHVSPLTRFSIENLDAMLTISASWNTKLLSGVDPKKIAMSSAAGRELFEIFSARNARGELKWCGTLFPTHSAAQDAEMSLDDYEDFVFGAMLVDRPDPIAEWQRVSCEQERLVKYLDEVKVVEIKGKDTHLTFRCAGRKWVNCDGKQNFPDGEIFTGPIEDSVEGTILFSYPAIYSGREVENVRLRFEKGRIVEAHATKGEDLLLATLDTDEGARFVGEIAIGTNYGITRFSRNTLFDEKIGGTVHLAAGMSLPESGGINKSAIHWDMVCDLRDGGEILADGRLIHKDGKFLI